MVRGAPNALTCFFLSVSAFRDFCECFDCFRRSFGLRGPSARGDLKLEPFSGVEIHMEMDMEWKWSGNGAQFVKIVWIGLDLGQSVALTPCDRHRTFTKRDKSNT